MIINTNEYTNENFVKNLEKTFPMANFEYYLDSIQIEKDDSITDIISATYPAICTIPFCNTLKNSILKKTCYPKSSFSMSDKTLKLIFHNNPIQIILCVDSQNISIQANENKFFNYHMDFEKKIISTKEYEIVAESTSFYRFFLVSFFFSEIQTNYEKGLSEINLYDTDLKTLLEKLDDLENLVYLSEMMVI